MVDNIISISAFLGAIAIMILNVLQIIHYGRIKKDPPRWANIMGTIEAYLVCVLTIVCAIYAAPQINHWMNMLTAGH